MDQTGGFSPQQSAYYEVDELTGEPISIKIPAARQAEV